jgi:hypothetical protein
LVWKRLYFNICIHLKFVRRLVCTERFLDEAYIYLPEWYLSMCWREAYSNQLEFVIISDARRLFLFVSMRWDCVSELRPTMGLLFITHVIYQCGDSRWNDTGRESRRIRRKTCPSATLSTSNPTRTVVRGPQFEKHWSWGWTMGPLAAQFHSDRVSHHHNN